MGENLPALGPVYSPDLRLPRRRIRAVFRHPSPEFCGTTCRHRVSPLSDRADRVAETAESDAGFGVRAVMPLNEVMRFIHD